MVLHYLIRDTIGLAFNMQRRTSVPYIFNKFMIELTRMNNYI